MFCSALQQHVKSLLDSLQVRCRTETVSMTWEFKTSCCTRRQPQQVADRCLQLGDKLQFIYSTEFDVSAFSHVVWSGLHSLRSFMAVWFRRQCEKNWLVWASIRQLSHVVGVSWFSFLNTTNLPCQCSEILIVCWASIRIPLSHAQRKRECVETDGRTDFRQT